jgi:hypothetical protein
MEASMRTLAAVATLSLGLAVAACNQAEQRKTQVDTQAASQDVQQSAHKVGEDVKSSAKDVSVDVKKIASDKDVKKAEGELKSAFKDFGASVKHAARKSKEGAHEAGTEAKEPADKDKG